MDISFKPTPNDEAIALIEGRAVVLSNVFYAMPHEIRARLFTVSGVDSTQVIQAVRDQVAAIPAGQTWQKSQRNIRAALEPFLGEDGAKRRAEIILRVNAYQAFATANHREIMEDPDTTHCRYVHGNCEVPTPSHLALDGIVLPKDDPFWYDHTGPWGHLGCVCTKIGLDDWQVARDAEADKDKQPDQKLVLTGQELEQLHGGKLVREGRSYSVFTAQDKYKWHPDYLLVSLRELKSKTQRQAWKQIEQIARSTLFENGVSLWDWIGRS
jgi:hypothetical protein